MRQVAIVGVGMTRFGTGGDRSLRGLSEEAVQAALSDAGLAPSAIGMVAFGNAAAGVLQGQEMIRGQTAMRRTGICGVPIINVENACASGSTAFNVAWRAVACGEVEVALAVGAEKLTHDDKRRTFSALSTALDQEEIPAIERDLYGSAGMPPGRSVFMDIYAAMANAYSQVSGATKEDYAKVAAKNHCNGALNPKAQYQSRVTEDDVLASRTISGPLTLLMCSPLGDGAAALVLCSMEVADRVGCVPIKVRASVLVSGDPDGKVPAAQRAARQAYELTGLGPEDLDVVELHDAAAPAELIIYEELGLCSRGEAPKLLATGQTQLGGRVPVNASGGLLSRGHPIGATGCAQLVELTEQLRGSCGARQVEAPRVALAENAGGWLGSDPAAATVTILSV
jgi:acetyl-CoA acyltransferase